MRKYLLALIAVIGFLSFAPKSHASIVRDATSTWITGASVSSITWNHTVTSTANPMLLLFSLTSNNDASATFNGVSLTKVTSTPTGTNGRWISFFALPNPATGTHAVILAGGGSELVIQGGTISYAGVNQSTVLDALSTFSTSTSQFSVTSTITTVTNNDWVFLGMRVEQGPQSSGTGSHLLQNSGTTLSSTYDHNAAVTPAGTVNMNVQDGSGSIGTSYIIAALAPAPAASVTLTHIIRGDGRTRTNTGR